MTHTIKGPRTFKSTNTVHAECSCKGWEIDVPLRPGQENRAWQIAQANFDMHLERKKPRSRTSSRG